MVLKANVSSSNPSSSNPSSSNPSSSNPSSSNPSSSEDRCLTDSTHPKPQLEVKPCSVEYARTCYHNWSPPLPITDESTALEHLIHEWASNPYAQGSKERARKPQIIVDLSDFDIYRSPGPNSNEYELASLHLFETKAKNLQLSGVLTIGGTCYFVDQVDIESYCVEGYNVDNDPNTVVYVRSYLANRDPDYDIRYRLGKNCARSYRRFHEPFIWIADLGKHVMDYLSANCGSSVGLADFRDAFSQWLYRRYGNCAKFFSWVEAYGKSDFRVPINAYVDYLFGQARILSNSEQLLKHSLWAECLKGEDHAVKPKPITCEKTIATPIVYHCFRGMYFANCLAEKAPAPIVRERQEHRIASLGFAVDSPQPENTAPDHPPPVLATGSLSFKVGDTVSVSREQGVWKTSDEEWLGYVQRIETLSKQRQRLFLIWLYRPTDTPIDSMVYPIDKELFFSDHCNCKEAPILSTDIIRKYTVDWSPKNINTRKDILVRQKYVTEDRAWVTLKSSDLECDCKKSKDKKSNSYQCGDCVYITNRKGRPSLEPVVISQICGTTDEITVRRLLRASRDCSTIPSIPRRHKAAPNELVWTDELFNIRAHCIERQCHIRFFPLEDVVSQLVPTPYNRGGNGDFWYISTAVTILHGEKSLCALKEAPKPMLQGFDPASTPLAPLRGLSIFSGGGNLDRGLEEGGAVRFNYAIDKSRAAILTQKANNPHRKDLNLYCGSVDDYLKAVLEGRNVIPIARIGDIQFIAAGSPCPGFSTMQPNWQSTSSLRNASLITTFASYADVYRPERALLENVVAIANNRKGFEDEKVFHQLIACLVALGYQVHYYLMDAWSHGSSQHRSRVFVSITAPGLEPMEKPFLTHSHPSTIQGRSLGTLVNGERFGSRENYATPFEYVTAGQATTDLPDIGSGTVQACISFPDHRVRWKMNGQERALVRCIPISPPGQGYAEALKRGILPDSLLINKTTPGKAFQRLKATSQFPTITTTARPKDNRYGNVLHWIQQRMISLMEARRGQGILDGEIIVGSISEQWCIIGNGVERNVALALGLSLRRAWEARSNRPPQDQADQKAPTEQEHMNRVEVIDLCSEDESAPLDSDNAASYSVTNPKATVFNNTASVGARATQMLMSSSSRLSLTYMRQKRARETTQTDLHSESTDRKRMMYSRFPAIQNQQGGGR